MSAVTQSVTVLTLPHIELQIQIILNVITGHPFQIPIRILEGMEPKNRDIKMKNKSVKFRTILTLVLLSISTLSVAELNKPTYCAMVRDDHITQRYIERGLKIREDVAFFLSKNPPKEVIQNYQDKYNNAIKNNYEKALDTAYKVDNQFNKEYPNNKFPQFARDQVDFHKMVEANAFENGGSIISNREWVYNYCMDVIKVLE
jgi:hypothetical protein